MSRANLSIRRRACAAYVFSLAIILNPARVNATGAMLYATEFQSNGNFFSVNTSTGAATVIGNANTFVPGIDFRPSNGTLYGASRSLQTIDVHTGKITTIASLPDLMISIAFSPTDQLYAINNSAPKTLYRLDPVTGSAISSVQISGTSTFGEIQGIDFGPDGTLYGAGYGLYSLNTRVARRYLRKWRPNLRSVHNKSIDGPRHASRVDRFLDAWFGVDSDS